MGKWYRQKEKCETLIETLNELFTKYIPPLINLIYDGIDGEEVGQPLDFSLPRTDLNLVQQMSRLLDAMLSEEEQDPD